jgi:hypothetical protein
LKLPASYPIPQLEQQRKPSEKYVQSNTAQACLLRHETAYKELAR